MIKLGQEIVTDPTESLAREWLETNGIGGYASSTVGGAHSRRYHGLLVATARPPLGRAVLLSKFEECLIIGDTRYELSTNRYPGVIYPQGFKFLLSFRLDPFPIWTYEISGITLEKRLFMISGSNATVVSYSIIGESDRSVSLELKPLIAFRDFHRLQHQDPLFASNYHASDGSVTVRPSDDLPPLVLSHSEARVSPQGYWYRNFEYSIEAERGFDCHEDLFQPFSLSFDLEQDAVVVAATERMSAADTPVFEAAEIERRRSLLGTSTAQAGPLAQLTLAADQFVVRRGSGKTVIAGYHWFSDWGRDTMIALPGLALATHRYDVARSILVEFAKYISQGMIPNRFPDEGQQPDYNTVDATLWFIEAIRAYVEVTGDLDLVRTSLFDKLNDIIDWHIRGTRYGIHVDTDGLLYAGEAGVQLTWMDAKIGDYVVTPRTGKAVEIQALWYNALMTMQDLAKQLNAADRSREYRSMAEIARSSFVGQFWNDDEECLFDVINGSQKDPSIRPNQIFAVSLRHSMLDHDRSAAVLQKVEDELLTPVGLRTLSPRDPRYIGTYIGSPFARDTAYHQGTVWAWLIGPYAEACRRVRGDDACSDLLSGLTSHLSDNMVGQISEIFDGDAPHTARGAAAQAWSVAETIRTLMRARNDPD